jgi:energy-coupling factor transporter ATP-binding protein EcfA2
MSDLPPDYQIGVLVGPSGTGKSTLLKSLAELSSATFPDDVAVVTAIASAVGVDMALELLDAIALPRPCRIPPRRVLSAGDCFFSSRQA